MTSPRLLLPGFEYRRIDVEGVTIGCAIRGSGPPVLMLHGYPQNHLAWRHVAPALAEDHTVVLAGRPRRRFARVLARPGPRPVMPARDRHGRDASRYSATVAAVPARRRGGT